MITNINFIVTLFIEMLITYMFFNSVSEKKLSIITTLVIGIIAFETNAVINIFVISNTYINIVYTIIANLILSLICFKIERSRAIFYSILLFVLSSLNEMGCVITISSLLKLHIINYQSNPVLLAVEISISKLFYLIVVMILIRLIRSRSSVNIKIPLSYYIYPITTTISVILILYISLTANLNYNHQILLGIIVILLIATTIVMFFAFQLYSQKENQLIILEQEQNKTKTDITYYEILEEQNNNLKTYAHDAKNHLLAIKNLNENPKINEYISAMFERLTEYGNVCHSGNKILDVIINKYVTECNLNNIEFYFDIKNNNLVNIEYYDAVTILGNLMDNAIEATEKSTNKQIKFETDYRNNFSVITITNSCDYSPKFNTEGTIDTTKSNKRLHGFGLRSVKKAIKKYNGDIAFDYDFENKNVIVTIMLDN